MRRVLPHMHASIVRLQTPGDEPLLLMLINGVIERDIVKLCTDSDEFVQIISHALPATMFLRADWSEVMP